MGHNFIKVGEEYDGGYVYSGVNSSPSLMALKWKHWLSEPGRVPVREERMISRLQAYPWYDLSKGPRSYTFKSDGTFATAMIRLSVSGVRETSDLVISLDGENLDWESDGSLDRQFYEWNLEAFSKGEHTLTLSLAKGVKMDTLIKQFCSVSAYEYGDESEFRTVSLL